MSLVAGDTDSERFFALITLEIERHDGDVAAGIAAAASWAARELVVFALNVILITRDELWALRYPDTQGLYVLERGPVSARWSTRAPLARSTSAQTISPAAAPSSLRVSRWTTIPGGARFTRASCCMSTVSSASPRRS